MTQNMRSPGNGFLGNIAKELMIVFNKFVINDSIKKLNIKKSMERKLKNPFKKEKQNLLLLIYR